MDAPDSKLDPPPVPQAAAALQTHHYQRLLAATVHDIGNAVSGALGCVAVLREGVADDGPFVDATEDALSRVARAVHALRRISAERPTVERVTPRDLVDDVLILCSHQMNRLGASLTVEVAADDAVQTDRGAATRLLFQTLVHILDQGIRSATLAVSLEGEALCFSLRSLPATITAPVPQVSRDGDRLLIRIACSRP